VFRQARHQVLWTLKDKVPTQVAKHDQGRHVQFSFRLCGFLVDLGIAARVFGKGLWHLAEPRQTRKS
jgi:hypothetical protein